MIILIFHLMLAAHADVPSTPPNPCYENCTAYMEELVNEFTTSGVQPELAPAVYSGECRHLGQYDPDFTHYAVVLIDEVEHTPNFSTIFSFFAENNEYAGWNVETARNEMSDYYAGTSMKSFCRLDKNP